MWVSLVAQRLKHLPTMQETWVQSLGREDPLEKETATHSSILAWRIPWTEELGRSEEEPGRLQSTVSQRLSDFTHSLREKVYARGPGTGQEAMSFLPLGFPGSL